MSKSKRLLMLIALLLPAIAEGRKPVPQPTLSDLATVWLGGTPKGFLEYYRLELTPTGLGTLAIQYLPGNPPVLYRITRTRLKDYEIAFDFEPSRDPRYGIYARGTATPGDLDLRVGGTTIDWKSNVFLERESAVLARIKAVSDCAKDPATCRTP